MKKYTTSVLVAVCVITWFAVSTAQALDTIVFVNLDRVFEEYHKTEKANEQLKGQADEFSEERNAMLKEYEELQEEFNTAKDDAQNPALSSEMRETKRDEAEDMLIKIRRKEKDVRRYEETRKKQLMDTERRVRKRLVGEIKDAVKVYAEEQGYAAVIDSSGQSLNAVESVVYHDARLDVTDKLLEILNAGVDKEPPQEEE